MRHTIKRAAIFPAIALLALILSACFPRGPQTSPTQDLNALFTAVAGTLTSQPPAPDDDQGGGLVGFPTNQVATNTPLAQVTATSSLSPSATNTPAPTWTSRPTTGGGTVSQSTCNQAQLISQKLSPNLQGYALGQQFTVTWSLKNTGTCTWTKNYAIIFSSGTNMASKKTFTLPNQVAPGKTLELTVTMHAPSKTGQISSNWLLRNEGSTTFGPTLAIKIVASGQIKTGYRYDFATNACNATWTSGTGSLSCPGTANLNGNQGFVLFTLTPRLETRHEDEPAIWVMPNHKSNGYVRGVYPAFEVASGDHFFAVIGCQGDRTKCNVRFTLNYINSNGVEKTIAYWDEKSDGKVTTVNVDLSSIAGKKVKFVLIVEPNNTSFDQDDAIWFLPSIRTAPAPTATNTSAPTATITLTASPTATDTATATATETPTETATDTLTP